MPLYRWSQSAASNGTADPTAPFPEGQAASSLNDSCRGAMAAVAQYRDDLSGQIVTGGTTSAYTVSSFQDFDNLADMNGKVIAFSPNQTNVDGPITLNVDSLGAFPLRSAPGVDLVAGTLVVGTPYTALFNNTAGEFYLQGFYSSPHNVPFLGGMDYWDTITPNSTFIFPAGQAISRTVYSRAFARWGTIFGPGDGSTTFNVPDKTGRVSAMIESTPTRLPFTAALGAAGGSATETLTADQIPKINSLNNASPSYNLSSGTTVGGVTDIGVGGETTPGGGFGFDAVSSEGNVGVSGFTTITANTLSSISTNTGGGAHPNVQPTIVCNYILRIL
jgi:microcystin-dependent protein